MVSIPAEANRPATARGAAFYRAVWRWHFYAGLFVVPVICILAVTGAIYLFKAEIEDAIYAPMVRVPAGAGGFAPLERQRAAILAAHPDAEVRGIRFADRTDRAAEWAIAALDGRKLAVFVDPYRGTVLGAVDEATRPTVLASRIHGTLLAGRFGEVIVELAACWALVLVATGLYLGWPRGRSLADALVPRLWLRGRAFWRELHVVAALWVAGALVFLVLSGLPWARVYGDMLASLGTVSPLTASSPHFRGAIVPVSGRPGASAVDRDHAEHQADPNLGWAVRHAPVPRSGAGSSRIDLDQLSAELQTQAMPLQGARISIPSTPTGVFKVNHLPDQVTGSRTLYIDQFSGRTLGDIGWRDYSPIAKATEFGVSVHLGREFGRANQWLGLFACVLIFSTAVTGAIMWWRRRPSGTLGAPRVAANVRIGGGLAIGIVAAALLLPLFGLSLLVIAALEWATLGILPSARKWLGLRSAACR